MQRVRAKPTVGVAGEQPHLDIAFKSRWVLVHQSRELIKRPGPRHNPRLFTPWRRWHDPVLASAVVDRRRIRRAAARRARTNALSIVFVCLGHASDEFAGIHASTESEETFRPQLGDHRAKSQRVGGDYYFGAVALDGAHHGLRNRGWWLESDARRCWHTRTRPHTRLADRTGVDDRNADPFRPQVLAQRQPERAQRRFRGAIER